MIALYERAVGYYSTLVNINAYHQPGVEAGKKAAEEIIDLQVKIAVFLKKNRNNAYTIEQIADALGEPKKREEIYHIGLHLSSNPSSEIEINRDDSIDSLTISAR